MLLTKAMNDGTDGKSAVVILNFGGPQSRDEVEPFLFELLRDRDVVRLPLWGLGLQSVFARLVARRRAKIVAAQYEAIGYSPLVLRTQDQARALERALRARFPNSPPTVIVGMRYTSPTIREAVRTLQTLKPSRVVALPLYPQVSQATTGSSLRAFARELRRIHMSDVTTVSISGFFKLPGYLDATKERILDARAKLEDPSRAHLLFSAHGIPQSFVRRGDPYASEVDETVRLVLAQTPWEGPTSLAFQSKVGRGRWLEPSTIDEIRRIASTRVREILVVPISFVCDHIETLYEVDVTFHAIAKDLGVTLTRTRALDTHPAFIEALADCVARDLAAKV